MGRRERRPRRPRRLSFTRSRSTLPRGRTRYPRRLAAKRVNFYHSNPRKLLNGRRNFLKPSWFPSSFRPLGFRAQKAICLGARGVQTGSKTVDPDRAPTPQRPQDQWARPAPGAGRAGARTQGAGGAPALTRPAADLSRGERCGALHPDPPWEELTPRARSAIEALNRDTMADITMRGEPMRSEHPLRE